jgi:hypothetical protein
MLKIVVLFLFSLNTGCKSLRGLSVDKVTDIFHHRIIIKSKELPERKFNPEYTEYYKEFVQDAKIRGVEFTDEAIKKLRRIEVVDKLSVASGDGVIAACNRYTTSDSAVEGFKVVAQPIVYKTIEVLRPKIRHFAQGRVEKVREVLYHEFFHCMMNKGHLPTGKSGIMSPTLSSSDNRARDDWKRLVDELFSPTFINLIPDT